MPLTKIQAAASVLGPALVATAIAGAALMGGEAGAETIPATIEDPQDEVTGPQAGCFAACAVAVWPEIVPAQVVAYSLRRGAKPDPESPRSVHCSAMERIVTDEVVFAALDLAGGVVSPNQPGCEITIDGTDVSHCIERGSVELDAAQVACAKSCAQAIDPVVNTIQWLMIRSGPPRTIKIVRGVDLSPHDYAAARAAGTVKPGQAE